MTAYLLAVALLGALLSGPFWMHYERRCAARDREWQARSEAWRRRVGSEPR